MNLQTTVRGSQTGHQFRSAVVRELRGLIVPLAVAGILPLAACTSVGSEVTQNSAAYPDVITYQIAAIKSSLHRELFVLPAPGTKPSREVNTDNLIQSGATPVTLAAAGFVKHGDGYAALHLPHSLADVSDSRIYGRYCSAHGGHLTRTDISGPNLPTGGTETCMQDDKLVFFSRWIVNGQVRCYGGSCDTDMAYDTVNLTPPVPAGQISAAAVSELVSSGYRPVK